MSTLVNTLDIPCSLAREYIPVYSLYRVLSSPFICSRCSWVNAICEAISSLLGHETHETIMQGEKSKRESSPLLKRKKKAGPKKQNDSIEEAKKIRLAASFHTTYLTSFSFPFPRCPFAVELRAPDFAFPIINQVSLQSGIIRRGL